MTCLFLISSALACASFSKFYHKYGMRGNVVDVKEEVVVICIGDRDGAEPGQKLEVFRTKAIDTGTDDVYYQREEVGSIRITSVIDEHYAKAQILSGQVQKYDMVELRD